MRPLQDSDRFPRDHPATVSVVIPAHNAADLLPIQLAALERQDYEYDWELIIADNQSTDDTARVAESWRDRLPIQVIAASDKPAASYARNAGARSARGELIAFCDADDEVSEGWLTALVEASLEVDAVGGAIEVVKLNDSVTASWNSHPFTTSRRVAGFLPTISGSNFCVWTDVLTVLNGLNEEYESSGQDVEFGWRLQLAGFRLGFSEDALVHYRVRSTLRSLARQHYKYGQASTQLYRDFRAQGMPRSSTRAALRSWAWLIVHLADLLRDRSRRGNWIRAAAMRTGKVAGSIEARTLYL